PSPIPLVDGIILHLRPPDAWANVLYGELRETVFKNLAEIPGYPVYRCKCSHKDFQLEYGLEDHVDLSKFTSPMPRSGLTRCPSGKHPPHLLLHEHELHPFQGWPLISPKLVHVSRVTRNSIIPVNITYVVKFNLQRVLQDYLKG